MNPALIPYWMFLGFVVLLGAVLGGLGGCIVAGCIVAVVDYEIRVLKKK